ncbi:hypothetical protein QJS04_geneDACA016471 [Acorus gramineus]|uniref:Uncharacterized protein n=1 Tax=Acorus gramineus TaxID=55184 RepID=A0AAV9B9B8_ACOGR|nr:hypothetical protein QJS04_geneDACA016471 [Acorus gramineus]
MEALCDIAYGPFDRAISRSDGPILGRLLTVKQFYNLRETLEIERKMDVENIGQTMEIFYLMFFQNTYDPSTTTHTANLGSLMECSLAKSPFENDKALHGLAIDLWARVLDRPSPLGLSLEVEDCFSRAINVIYVKFGLYNLIKGKEQTQGKTIKRIKRE